MAEGTPENKVTYFTVQGHSHDGVNSTKVDFTGYDLYDFISEGDLKRLILSVVDSNPIRPRGGIIIEAMVLAVVSEQLILMKMDF